MGKRLLILSLCFALKAQFVLGAEAAPAEGKLIAETTADVATISPDKEITVAQVRTETYEMADAASVLGTKIRSESRASSFSLYPMMGTSLHTDGWRNVVNNSYIFGLGLEVPASPWLGLALEGSYGDYDLRYSQYATGITAYHNFSMVTASGLAKFYLGEGWFRPYLGGGMDAIYFEGQNRSGLRSPFTRWVGAATVMAGTDFEVAHNLAIGVRASYSRPFLNTPQAFDPISQYPEGNVMTVPYFRFMGNLRVSL